MKNLIRRIIKHKKYDVKRIYGKDKTILILLAISLCFSICLFLLGFLTFIEIIVFPDDFISGVDFLVFGVLYTIGPIGFYNHLKVKKRKEIENELGIDFIE